MNTQEVILVESNDYTLSTFSRGWWKHGRRRGRAVLLDAKMNSYIALSLNYTGTKKNLPMCFTSYCCECCRHQQYLDVVKHKKNLDCRQPILSRKVIFPLITCASCWKRSNWYISGNLKSQQTLRPKRPTGLSTATISLPENITKTEEFHMKTPSFMVHIISKCAYLLFQTLLLPFSLRFSRKEVTLRTKARLKVHLVLTLHRE